MAIRHFTIAELAEFNVPPDDPTDLSYEEYVLADEQVTVLKYTALRRCIFADDEGHDLRRGYQAPLDTGDYEVGDGMPDNHGWLGDTVEAVEVKQLQVVVKQWVPVF